MTALKLSRPLATRLLFEAQKQPDKEVCGLLSARDGEPWDLYPVANIAADPTCHFEMDPAGQIQAHKTMRERGEQLLAIYHSHPDMPPVPSEHDVEGQGYPEALYLIISLDIKGVLEMRAWQRDAEGMREITLTVMD